MNPHTKRQIQNDIDTIERILSSGILDFEKRENLLWTAAFRELLICLRDLMAKAAGFGLSISFTDDIIPAPKIADVSDLIIFMRNAIGHPESSNHIVRNSDIELNFTRIYGKASIKIHNTIIASDYEDDIAFCFGSQRIYLHRHIIRAFQEAKTKLLFLF